MIPNLLVLGLAFASTRPVAPGFSLDPGGAQRNVKRKAVLVLQPRARLGILGLIIGLPVNVVCPVERKQSASDGGKLKRANCASSRLIND
jgi:hypothetical protein